MTDEQQKGLNDTPVQDISDSKDEAEKSFLKELDDAEKSQPVAATSAPQQQSAPNNGGDKPKSKFAAAMESASKPKRRHSMDPILAVSLVILLLASVVVLGNAGYANFIEKGQTTTVAYGDTVAVQYTGAFKEYYKEGETTTAVVFDTNIESVGKFLDDHPDAHSWSYTKKTSYTDLSFTVGGDTVLKKFGSATINHKVGDVITVKIEKSDGYELPETSKGKVVNTAINTVITMTASEFSALYGFTAPISSIQHMEFSSATQNYCPFGCSYDVCTVDGKVQVTNYIKAGETYHAYGLDKAEIKFTKMFGNYEYLLNYNLSVSETGKMTKAPVFHDNAWTVGYIYEDDETTMYKIGETLGADLYFYIKVTKITKA